MSIAVCLFGFYRNADNYSHNIKDKVYVFTPSINNEGLEDKVTEDMITFKYTNSKVHIYDYNKQIHIDKVTKLNIPYFNEHYQQHYRIFSFFYNIKNVLEMASEDIIILARIDIGLTIKYEKIDTLLSQYDVILGSECYPGTDDKFFIFKSIHKHIFMSLYDEHESYLTNYYKGSDLPCTRPEDVFLYHIKKNNLSFVFSDVISYDFNHVCSKYCGHNGINTLT
jgi:hypothetical protein